MSKDLGPSCRATFFRTWLLVEDISKTYAIPLPRVYAPRLRLLSTLGCSKAQATPRLKLLQGSGIYLGAVVSSWDVRFFEAFSEIWSWTFDMSSSRDAVGARWRETNS